MKDKWYGDDRDLVKWGILLHLARSFSAKRILQVAYFRRSTWAKIEIGGQEYPIPSAVIKHFRNLLNIQNLSSAVQIQILDSMLTNRDQYKQDVVAKVVDGQHPCVVFLDPDTGLEPPRSRPGLEHVLDSELAYIWKEMSISDVLVFYQHMTNRNGQPWIEPKRSQFERALKLPHGSTKVARGLGIAADIALFYCRKETE